MSSILPTGLPGIGQEEGDGRPRLRAIRLRQNHDVSSAPALHGDSLVYDDTTGKWTPLNVTPGTGEITNDMLAPDSVTTDKIAPGAVASTDIANDAITNDHISTGAVNADSIATDAVDADAILAGAVGDTELGDRTVSDATAPTVDTGPLTGILGWIVNRIKAITGEAGWKDNPDTTLATAHAHHINTSNPHNVTLTQVGGAAAVHTHADVVAAGASGFMTGADKTKLNGVEAGATAGPTLSNSTPSTVTVGASADDGSSSSASKHDHVHGSPNLASAVVDGFMSATDKSKLNGIEAGATSGPALSSSSPDSITVGQSGGSGSSTLASRADHQHSFPAAVSLVSTLNTQGGINATTWDLKSRSSQDGQLQESASTDLTLTSSDQTVVSQIVGAGGYLILARFDFVANNPTTGGTSFLTCELDSVELAPGPMTISIPDGTFASITGAWFAKTDGGTIRIRARTGASGGSMPAIRRGGGSGNSSMLLLDLGAPITP
jgi:hypothetical protein